MAFVRFSRDKRGYEHVYLVDTSNRGRSRVLYWFRTPPGVKVGRAAFDPDTQRSLERQNPDVQFDWPQIMAARIPAPAVVETWREKRRIERAIKRARAADAAEAVELERIAEIGEPDLDDRQESLVEPLVDAAEEAIEEEAEPLRVFVTESTVTESAVTESTVTESTPIAGGAEAPRRGRRRRRRRGRRSGDRPPQATQSAGATAPNGPLDPANPPEKPSNEE